jgi:NADP-dependent 3-hydroxy acid dehydrogenase YdfG
MLLGTVATSFLMKATLKPLHQQTVVLTGASSPLGQVLARQAADRGARLVLASLDGVALCRLADEITGGGGQAIAVVADVSDRDDVRAIAHGACVAFGGFDTWVNGAGAFLSGRLDEVAVAEMRKVFGINLWGLLYGSLEAVDHLRHKGGALINVGSVLSARGVMLQGIYSASKYAAKEVTDALRLEVEEEGAPISVTFIRPSGLGPTGPSTARSAREAEATVPQAVYAPELVARAILHCAEHSRRDVSVGGGTPMSAHGTQWPRPWDSPLEAMLPRRWQADRPPRSKSQHRRERLDSTVPERCSCDGGAHAPCPHKQSGSTAGHALLLAALAGVGLGLAATP